MKRIITASVMALVIGGAGSVFAQGWGDPDCPRDGKGYYHHDKKRHHGQRFHRDRREFRGGFPVLMELRHLEAMKVRLKLTDAQVKKIFDINTKYREKFFNAGKDIDKTDQLRLDRRKEIKSVLTAEQKKQIENFGRGSGQRSPSQRGYGY